MKILFITQGFPPVQHSGVFRSEAFVKYLPDSDVEPIVVCNEDPLRTAPAYDSGRAQESRRATAVLRFSWGTGRRESILGGVRGIGLRFPVVNSAIRHWDARRIAARVASAVVTGGDCRDVRVVYGSSPPNWVQIVAQRLAHDLGVPYVCDLRDPWSYGWEKTYRSRLDFLMERREEYLVLSQAAAVVANTNTARQVLIDVVGIDSNRVTVIPNGYDDHLFDEGLASPRLDSGKFNVLYTGVLSPMEARADWKVRCKRHVGLDYAPVRVDVETRSMRYVCEALRLLRARDAEVASTVCVHVYGNATADVRGDTADLVADGLLEWHPTVSQEVANRLCLEADLLLLLQVQLWLNEEPCSMAVPGKLFNYLHSGKPILAPMQDSEATELISKLNAGTVVPPRDVEGIAKEIASRVREFRATGRVARTKLRDLGEYSRHFLTKRLAELLRSVVSQPSHQ